MRHESLLMPHSQEARGAAIGRASPGDGTPCHHRAGRCAAQSRSRLRRRHCETVALSGRWPTLATKRLFSASEFLGVSKETSNPAPASAVWDARGPHPACRRAGQQDWNLRVGHNALPPTPQIARACRRQNCEIFRSMQMRPSSPAASLHARRRASARLPGRGDPSHRAAAARIP